MSEYIPQQGTRSESGQESEQSAGPDSPGDEVRRTLRAFLDSMVPEYGPGLFALVTQDGREVFSGAAGTADLARPRAISEADRFRVGSVTKPFVAALVLKLVEDNALSLDDSVKRWLPGIVPGADRITVEHLLRMRSGIPHYVPALFGDPPDPSVYARYHTPESLVTHAVGAAGWQEPDARHAYSSTNYVLLGLIAERATGWRLPALLWERILNPLGLRDTDLPEADPHLRGPHATGYARAALGEPYADLTAASPSESWAAGGLVSTPHDVAHFLDTLMTGGLLDESSWRAMSDTHPTGDRRGYGMGLMRLELPRGHHAYGHTGATAGFNCVALRTDTGRTVVLYRNALDLTNPLPLHTPFVMEALTS
ncbi:serine hydrolase domain-containing protein [Streptomyces sp. B6B3]|uniref:serine hydrolase domain-containing protein n=1 Tax=Streptomyces sp. B6B3 TaxID=3153570 RepID=UPI00325DDE30